MGSLTCEAEHQAGKMVLTSLLRCGVFSHQLQLVSGGGGDSRWELSKPDKGDLTNNCGEGTSPGQRSVRSPPLLEHKLGSGKTGDILQDSTPGAVQTRTRWAALMSVKLYVLISWPDGSRVINIENIKEPRKPFHRYTVGEQVLARCPGFSGLYWGMLEGISEHKDILEKKLLEDRQLLEKLKEEPAVHSMMPPQPKKSRKTFPKWTSGNASRKYHGDRTYVSKPLLRAAEASLPHDAGSSSIAKERCALGNVAGGPPPAPTHPRPHLSPWPCQGLPRVKRTGLVHLPERKSDGILSPCQQHICLNSCEEQKLDVLQEMDDFERVQKNFGPGEMERVEKMEQLERMVVDLQQDVLSLKKKVQRLESLSFQEEPHRQPCEVVELFNGYTKEQLKETIRFDQKISTACKTLLYKLFTSDYIQSHSITGRRGNTFREAKPMMDERCIKIIRVLLKQKFGDHLSDTVITEKIQNVQKALRQKFKTECL
ncbi:hypothetical protein A306_00000196 [Columba livia]|uniref:BEN domain-containing protein n=1 Tax=Columba livia TaxID=8932 RepID=A0A2I0M650_COLLI|nr:hypothetical protein A306_00000196 [Columba livia]